MILIEDVTPADGSVRVTDAALDDGGSAADVRDGDASDVPDIEGGVDAGTPVRIELLTGSGRDSVLASATDSSGNLYIIGNFTETIRMAKP
ncbi:MAG: hypothetical protein ACI9KE_003123, partial [Polyangiales bacterium]